MFKGRSVIEIMVLVFTFVVATMIVGLSILIILVELRNPEADTGIIANTMMSLVSGILGALLGLIAGKSGSVSGSIPPADFHKKPDGEENGIE